MYYPPLSTITVPPTTVFNHEDQPKNAVLTHATTEGYIQIDDAQLSEKAQRQHAARAANRRNAARRNKEDSPLPSFCIKLLGRLSFYGLLIQAVMASSQQNLISTDALSRSY